MWVRAHRAGAAPASSFAAASKAPGLSPGRWHSGSAGARVSQAARAAAPVISGKAAKDGCLLKWEVSTRKCGLCFLRRCWVRRGKWGKHCSLEAHKSPERVISCNFILALCPLLLFQYYFCFLPKGWIILPRLWLPINFAISVLCWLKLHSPSLLKPFPSLCLHPCCNFTVLAMPDVFCGSVLPSYRSNILSRSLETRAMMWKSMALIFGFCLVIQ